MPIDPIKRMYLTRQRENVEALFKYKQPKPAFYASELGQCKRRIYYRLAGYIPSARGARSDDYGHDGDMHHDNVRNVLRANGVKLAGLTFNKDGTVKEDASYVLTQSYGGETFDISMRLDGFIYIDRKKHTLEIKSLGFWKLKPLNEVWERTKSEDAILGWLEQHRRDILYQVHANMAATKIKRTYLLFKDRSDCAIGLHSRNDPTAILGGVVVEFREHIWEHALKRMAIVSEALRTRTPPRPEHIASSNECMYYCPFKHLCHAAEQRRKQGLEPAELHPQLGAIVHVEDRK